MFCGMTCLGLSGFWNDMLRVKKQLTKDCVFVLVIMLTQQQRFVGTLFSSLSYRVCELDLRNKPPCFYTDNSNADINELIQLWRNPASYSMDTGDISRACSLTYPACAILSAASLAPTYFSTLSYKEHDFLKIGC